MYLFNMSNFTEIPVHSFNSNQISLDNLLNYKKIINKINQEIRANQTKSISGFWWHENEQISTDWFKKIRRTWHTELSDFQEIYRYIKTLFDSEEIDLTFQHGLMGFLLWLNRENQTEQDETVDNFIEKTIEFLLSKKMKLNSSWQQFSFLPEAFDEDTWTSNNSLQWKVGDLHFVKLLHRQAKRYESSNYYEIAENIGLHSTTRTSEEQTGITDSSLANGSSGLAVLYKALYRETGGKEYLKSSNYWTKQTELLLKPELQNGYYLGRESRILDGLLGVSIVLQELQKEELSPLLTYLAG
ncbi:MAG: lanthionine synthetase LanC family protein [Arcicella sp.]|nr:lanthionine synthetase LanC family protein [Arcicella sp.]